GAPQVPAEAAGVPPRQGRRPRGLPRDPVRLPGPLRPSGGAPRAARRLRVPPAARGPRPRSGA
ncbi:unnamed protein product, partial [Prorocentrum cordatum]